MSLTKKTLFFILVSFLFATHLPAMDPHAKEIRVYSFGTGQTTLKDLSNLGNGGYLQWGPQIASVLMKNAASYTDFLIQKEVARDPRIKYIRIHPHITNSEKPMDNVKVDNIEKPQKISP